MTLYLFGLLFVILSVTTQGGAAVQIAYVIAALLSLFFGAASEAAKWNAAKIELINQEARKMVEEMLKGDKKDGNQENTQ